MVHQKLQLAKICQPFILIKVGCSEKNTYSIGQDTREEMKMRVGKRLHCHRTGLTDEKGMLAIVEHGDS